MNEKIEMISMKKSDLVKYREDIIDLMIDAWKISFPNDRINFQEITARYESLLEYIEYNKGYVLAALSGDKLLGYLWYFVSQYNRIHVNQIILKQETRGRGIGSNLLEELYIKAKSLDVHGIELNVSMVNEKAIEFYKKQNFKVERILMKRDIID